MAKTLQQLKNDKKAGKKNNNITDADYVLRDKDEADALKNTINMTPSIPDMSPEDIEKQRIIQEKIEEEKEKIRQKEIDEAVAKGIEEFKAQEAKAEKARKAKEAKEAKVTVEGGADGEK